MGKRLSKGFFAYLSHLISQMDISHSLDKNTHFFIIQVLSAYSVPLVLTHSVCTLFLSLGVQERTSELLQSIRNTRTKIGLTFRISINIKYLLKCGHFVYDIL